MTVFERAHAVVQAANLQDYYSLERLDGEDKSKSAAREVWFYGPYVLRIHQDNALEGEARLLRLLPTGIPHAPVVAAGEGWIVQKRVSGEPLSAVWRSLDATKQRAAAQQLAAILINLHQLRISGMPSLSPGWFAAILPDTILKLAAQLRARDPALLDAVIQFTRRTMTEVTPPLRWGFVHRALHFDHVLWNGERITALLDFEYAVLAPRELELDAINRFVRHPGLTSALEPGDLESLIGWLREDYPLLFGEAGVEKRLKLYSIEHDLRLLAADPDRRRIRAPARSHRSLVLSCSAICGILPAVETRGTMDALQFVPILVVGFATSLGLTPLSRAIALRLGVVDKPSQRKLHLDNKPMMGGLAIYVGFALALLLFSPPQYLVELGALLSGAAFLAIVGLIDDRFLLSAQIRLVCQALAAVVLIASGIHIQLFNQPLIDYPLTILWVAILVNATNYLDNMDGLAAGFSAIAAGFFTLIAFTQGLTLVSALGAALMGSAVGFLVYNFNPASTFMGDMGSVVLGFVLAVLGIKLEFGAQPLSVTWMVPLLVLALPLVDFPLVTITRILEGRSPLDSGKDHISHRLMSLGLSQRWTLFVLYGGCTFFGFLALLVSNEPPERALWIGLGGLALMGTVFIVMMVVRRKYQLAPKSG